MSQGSRSDTEVKAAGRAYALKVLASLDSWAFVNAWYGPRERALAMARYGATAIDCCIYLATLGLVCTRFGDKMTDLWLRWHASHVAMASEGKAS